MLRRHLIRFLLWLVPQAGLAQQAYLDSLLYVVRKPHPDTTQAHLLREIGSEYNALDSFPAALRYTQRALVLYRKANHLKGAALSMNYLGNMYHKLGDYEKSIDYYLQAALLAEKSGFPHIAAYAFNGMAIVYMEVKDHEKSLAYYKKALAIYEKDKKRRSYAGNVLNNIGENYLNQQQYDSAQVYFARARQTWVALGEKRWMASTLSFIGTTYVRQNRLDSAFANLTTALRLQEKLNENYDKLYTLYGLALAHQAAKTPAKAIACANQCLALAKQIGVKIMVRDAAGLLADLYASDGNYGQAFRFQKTFAIYQDSLLSDEKLRNVNRLQLARKEAENELLRKENSGKESQLRGTLEENRRQRMLAIGTGFGLLLVSGLSYVLYASRRRAKKLNTLLRQKNKEVEEIAENLSKSNAAVTALSEDLEQKVIRRTQRLEEQNQLLRKYAFYNAHKLRGPLARILGITHLVKMGQETLSEKEALTLIEDSAYEMDTVIREINDSLNNHSDQETFPK